MGRASRDKGNRFEREIVNTYRSEGFEAQRVPLSGGAGGDFQDDIILKLPTGEIRGEAKARANGFKQIYDWLKPKSFLYIKADRERPLVIMDLQQFIGLLVSNNLQRSAPYISKVQLPSPTQSSYLDEIKAIRSTEMREDSLEVSTPSQLTHVVRVGKPPILT